MGKIKITLTIDEETKKRFTEIVNGRHTTYSQWLTDRIWEYAPVHQTEINFYDDGNDDD